MLLPYLIANTEAFREASRYMERSASWRHGGFILVILGGIAALWAGLYFWEQHRQNRPSNKKSPKSLFADLCRRHQLSRAQRALLLAAVAGSKPEDAARVFVDPNLLGRLALTPSPESDAYSALLNRLFGDESG